MSLDAVLRVSLPDLHSDDKEDTNTAVVIVHSPKAGSKRPPSGPKRGTPRASRDGGGAADPHNYLLSGGNRALQCERAQQQAAWAREQVKGMRSSNAQLAGQLVRARQEAEREAGTLRAELAALAGRFRAEQERLAGLRERLAEECRGQAELEAAHQERVRDLHKRLQAEHLLRVNAELEGVRATDRASSAAVELKGMEQQVEATRREAAELRDACLEAEAVHNRERLQQAGLLAELEGLKTAVAQERHTREAQQKKGAELEASLRSLSSRSSELQEQLRSAREAAEAATTARVAADAAAARHRQDLTSAQEQLAAARQVQAATAAQAAELQERLMEMESATALYIAKEAHYDDLKAEHDEACQQLERCRDDLARARAEARSAADQLGELSRQAAKMPALSAELEQAQEDLGEVRSLLGETQAAFKLLMGTVREKEAAVEALEGQADELRSVGEALRRARDHAAAALQDKEAEVGGLLHELRVGQEEAGSWQRRCKQLQGEADGRELELARRDLRAKELEDALHVLSAKGGEEAAAAASERQGLEDAVKSLEGRLAQARMELARTRDELSGAEQGQMTARAELEAAQQHGGQLHAQLNEEQLRASKLRGELASLSGSHIKDAKEKSGLLADTLARLQAEEAAKLSAQQEARSMRRRVEELEGSLSEAGAAAARSQEAYDSSQAALESMRKKLEAYKRENKSLLSSYDQWIKSVVATRQPVVGASP